MNSLSHTSNNRLKYLVLHFETENPNLLVLTNIIDSYFKYDNNA